MKPVLRLSPWGRLGLLIAVSLATLGARFFWVSINGALLFQSFLGYYFVLTLLVLWVVFAARAIRARGWFRRAFWREHRAGLIAIGVVSVFMHLHEPHMMRVLFDEPSHLLTSLVMHWDKRALMAGDSNYVGDAFVLTRHYVSYRQYLFPLLISLLHDFTGYRVANIFIVNALLTPLVLLLAYWLGVRLGGKIAGLIAVGLLGSFPLLAQNVTSGGYDVLNVVLLGVLVLVTLSYVEAPIEDRGKLMNLSLATVLLMAVARYESVLYIIPWAVVTFVLWWRARRVELTAFAIISPIFLLPSFMSNIVMMAKEATMYVHLRRNGEAFFDIGNLPKHLSEAVYYFFNFDLNATNSLLLALLGLIAFIAFLVKLYGFVRNRATMALHAVVALFATWTLLAYLFALTMFWSSPTDALVARFCLPLMFICASLAGWLAVQWGWLRGRPVFIYSALILWAVVAGAPATSRAFATRGFTTGPVDEWFIEYAKTRPKTRTLFIESSSVTLATHRFAASDIEHLGANPSRFVRAVKAGLYKEVIVFQTLEPNVSTGEWRARQGNELPENFVLEKLDERLFSPIYLGRIYRLVGYKKPDGTLITPLSDDPEINLQRQFKNDLEWHAYILSLYP